MGMSAGQARLLSVTARLTDNELRSQMLTNSKLRLADKSTEASNKYMDALNSQQLMYTSYDGSGNKLTEALTANTILTFADLKNQYAMVNTAGQVLVAGSDIKNFKASDTMADFMYAYGIEKVDNPKYPEVMKDIYSDATTADGTPIYEDLYDEENPNYWVDYFNTLTSNGLTEIQAIANKNPEDVTVEDANSIGTIISNWQNSVRTENGGILANYSDLDKSKFGNYVIELLSNPGINFPDEDDDQFYDVSGDSQLAQDFNIASYKCYQNAQNTSVSAATGVAIGSGCYLHVLAHLLISDADEVSDSDALGPNVPSGWSKNEATTVPELSISVGASKINSSAINSNGQSKKLADVSEYIWTKNEGGPFLVPEDETDTTTESSLVVDRLLSNYKWVDNDGDGTNEKTLKTWPERVIDLYYVVENYKALGLNYNDLLPYLDQFQTDMETALSKVFNEERYWSAVENWQNSIKNWLKNVTALQAEYEESLSTIPPKQIPDETDSRYQWYKNLWYRMGGISEKEKDDSGRHYKELDPNLLNNAEWLEFALEHGIITLEQAQFNKDGSVTYPNMGTYDWTSIIYTNAADIVSQEDSAAIALAEVEYENAVRDIQNEDKKIDQDLKKLDTEHSALQTEYDSIKSVIDKNVERSFKAFS